MVPLRDDNDDERDDANGGAKNSSSFSPIFAIPFIVEVCLGSSCGVVGEQVGGPLAINYGRRSVSGNVHIHNSGGDWICPILQCNSISLIFVSPPPFGSKHASSFSR